MNTPEQRMAGANRLIASFTEDDAERLDEAVHEAKAREAADINNSGLAVQINFLLDAGLTEAEIREMLES